MNVRTKSCANSSSDIVDPSAGILLSENAALEQFVMEADFYVEWKS